MPPRRRLLSAVLLAAALPLAAHARWQGDELVLDAALGHGSLLQRPLLRAQVRAAVTDEAAAEALGRRAVEGLRAAGAGDYLVMP